MTEQTTLVRPRPRHAPSAPKPVLWLLTVAVPLALLATWVYGSEHGLIAAKYLPAPADVLGSLISLSADGALLTHLGISLQRALLGLALGALFGLIAGAVTGLSVIGGRLIDPTLQGLRTVPPLALLSLFILWFGVGEQPKVTLIALGAAFPVYINTIAGIRACDSKLLELAHVFELTRLQTIRLIVLPQALPSVFAGLRLASSISIMLLVAAEQVANSGLGFLLIQGQSYFDSAQVILVILIYALLGILADLLLRLAQRLVTPWTKKGAQR